jgi:hypothetical protein
MKPILIAALLLAAPAVATPAGSERVELDSFRGLPADAQQRDEFLDGFDGAFEDSALAAETHAAGEWRPRAPLVNRFRLRPRSLGPAWRLQVFVELPQLYGTRFTPGHVEQTGSGSIWVPGTPGRGDRKRRAARGLVVSVRVRSPGDAEFTGDPERTSIAFPAPPGPDGSAVLSPHAYEIPWRDAGRAAGLIALEALHRKSGELSADERLDLSEALRVDADR